MTFIEELTVLVYKRRLEDDCQGAVDRMLALDEDKKPGCGERFLRSRARAYEPIVRATAAALGIDYSKLRTWEQFQEDERLLRSDQAAARKAKGQQP